MDKIIKIRVSAEDKAAFERSAAYAEISLSTWARFWLRHHIGDVDNFQTRIAAGRWGVVLRAPKKGAISGSLARKGGHNPDTSQIKTRPDAPASMKRKCK